MKHLNFFENWYSEFDNKRILERRNTGIIYHFTSLINTYHIIKDDKMVSYRQDDNINVTFPKSKVPIYLFSFTRDKNLSKRIEDGQIDTILTTRLDIDGTKLSDKYKIRPYDYWGGSSVNKISSESEEVLLKNDSYLKNINGYILDITFPTYGTFRDEFEFYIE